MPYVWIVVAVVVLALLLALAIRVVKQYERGVIFRLGRVIGVRKAGLNLIIPFIDVLHRVSLRIITMPIQSQGIITRDNVSVDVSSVAYYRVDDAVKAVVAIENVGAAISPKPPYARWSGSTPSTRRCPRPTGSTSISGRSSTSRRLSEAWWSPSSSSRTSNYPTA